MALEKARPATEKAFSAFSSISGRPRRRQGRRFIVNDEKCRAVPILEI